jgi:hypothetical protein
MKINQKVITAISVAAAFIGAVVLASPNGPIPLSGYVAVKNGGTGVQTLTGIPKASGTSAFTAATGADISATFSGTCNSTTFLRADGTCVANTGASTSATNTWTAQNTFSLSGVSPSSAISLASNIPAIQWNETDAAADGKLWDFVVNSGFIVGRISNDAGSTSSNWIAASRSTSSVLTVALGNSTDNPTISGNGVDMTPSSATGTATLSTGCTTTPTSTYNIYKIGKMVVLRFMSSISCTSNSTIRSFGVVVPAAQRPATQVCAGTVAATNNGASGYASVRVQSNGTVDVGFNTDCAGGSWTSSGTTSITNFAVTYTTD